MNMLGLLPKITDNDWGYIQLWLHRAEQYKRKEFPREELPLLDREYVRDAGEEWLKMVLHRSPHYDGGSFYVMKKLFG